MKKNFSTILCLISINLGAWADDLPEKNWELGVGIGSVYGPDYRGSDEYRSYTSLIPYVVYHGKFLHSDRDGVRAQFFSSDTINFSLSASAYISPHSDENKRREGMPDLGSTVELGPALNIRLSGDDLHNGWQLQLPVRAVLGIGGSQGMIGTIFQPQFLFQKTYPVWNFRYRMGAMFGDNRYHDYYYSVEAPYVQQERPLFDAGSGYSGAFTDVAFSRTLSIREQQTRFAFFVRYENLHNSVFESSPLLMTNNVWRAGAAFIWVIE